LVQLWRAYASNQLKETSELPWGRVGAPPQADVAAIRREMAVIRDDLGLEIIKLRGELGLEIVDLRGELLKWLFFVFWSGSMVALGALIIWAVGSR
jgi:hypothetical protein